MSTESERILHDSLARLDERFEELVLRRAKDALLEDGDQIYIRKIEGRLQWIRANVHGGGQEWQELTPHLAMDRLAKRNVGEVDEESLEKLKDLLAAAQNPEAYEIGWYQDAKGDLYQFDGKTWLGSVPSKKAKETFEFLGK